MRIEDFGAGDPAAARSREAMARGRVIERTVGATCLGASKPPLGSRLLFLLVRRFRPRVCLELGCCLGISAAFQAAALALNGDGGRLWSLEGAPALARAARRNLAQLALDVEVVEGRFQDTLPPLLSAIDPIDYAFVDGHHDELATLEYFERVVSACAPRALLVFDDIRWSDGMRRAWETIARDPRAGATIDCGEVGLCVVDSTIRERVRARAPLA